MTQLEEQRLNLYSLLENEILTESMQLSKTYEALFWRFVDQVNLELFELGDQFYSYFVQQMNRNIRLEMPSPTGISFSDGHYVMHFNPYGFLGLTIPQMLSSMKHEILHLLSRHLIRAREYKGRYSETALNMAMDLVVNKYLTDLPPYAITLEMVNSRYGMRLKAFEPFEYYAEALQLEMDLELDQNEEEIEDVVDQDISSEFTFQIDTAHEMWSDLETVEGRTLDAFIEQILDRAANGKMSPYLEKLVKDFKCTKEQLPWQHYLARLLGTIAWTTKKTTTRRNRRQPERLDLRGTLRQHKPKVVVAVDSSGSMSDAMYEETIREVLQLVKATKQQITLVECDQKIQKVYELSTLSDLQTRSQEAGGTAYSPVIAYANQMKPQLLVYFTDGQGEASLMVRPRGYKVLWVLTGNSEGLSLEEAYGTVKQLGRSYREEMNFEMEDVRQDGYSMNNQQPML